MAAGFDPKRLARLERAYGKLLAAQDAKSETEDLTAYADDPEGFIRDVLGDTRLWAKPRAMIESVRTNRKTTVRGAVAMGKGHTAAEIALWWMFARHGFVIVTGSTQEQVFRNFFAHELGRLWGPRKNRLGGELYKRALVPAGMTAKDIGEERLGIVGVVSKDISNMTGSHGALILCIVDEAQGVKTSTCDALYNNATGPDDRFLMIGNPSPPDGDEGFEFYQSHQDGSGWHRIQMQTVEHPNIVESRVVIPGGPSHVWLNDMRKVKGEKSPWWRTFVEAEFPERKVDALLSKSDVEAMKTLFLGEFRARANNQPYIIGIDLAKGGGDRGGMAIMRGPVLLEIYSFDTSGVIETEQRIVEKLREIGAKPANRPPLSAPFQTPWGEQIDCVLVVDSAPTGAGPGIIGHLRADHGYEVIAFNGSSRVHGGEETERYENKRAFGYWGIKLAAQDRRLAICADVELEEELLSITYSFTKSDGVLITPKKEIMKTLKRSPDKADPFMMAWSQYDDQASIGGTVDNMGF